MSPAATMVDLSVPRPGCVAVLRARLTGKDTELSLASVRMMRSREADVTAPSASWAGSHARWSESTRAARFWAAMTVGKRPRGPAIRSLVDCREC